MIYIDDHDNADWIKRVSRSVTAAANEDHSGSSIVAWTPTSEEADSLSLPGGETSDHLHCTLVYLGRSEAVPESVPDIVAAIASRFSPFVARVQGTAIFNTDDGDVLVRLLDAPELEQIQQRLHDEIAAVMEIPDTHGFTAHVTLKYLAPDEEIDAAWFKLPPSEVKVNSITTDFGTDRTDYPLATEVSFGEASGHPFRGNQYTGPQGSDREITTTLPAGTSMFHTTRRADADPLAFPSRMGESGPGTYVSTDRAYADKLQSYDETMHTVEMHTTDDFHVLDRDKPGGEERYRELIGPHAHTEPEAAGASLKAAGFDGVRHTSPGEEHPETTILSSDKVAYSVTSSIAFGEGTGHPFRGNQWTEGSGSEEKLVDEVFDWSKQFPEGTIFRAMHRLDLDRVMQKGKLDSGFDGGKVFGAPRAGLTIPYLDRNEVVIAYHAEPHEREGAGGTPYTITRSLPTDRILGVFDPKDAAPVARQSTYKEYPTFVVQQELEFGEDIGHAFRGNQYTGGIGGEKGEWESTSGTPRLAPLEKRDGKNKGKALPIEMITMKELPPDIREKVMDKVRDRVASTQKINASFDHFMEVAWNNPELRESGMNWYQQTHDLAFKVAADHDLEPQSVAAAFAAMSPGKVWSEEAGIIQGMADMDQGNVHLSPEKLDLVNQKMDAYGMDHVDNGDKYSDMGSRQAVITMQSQFMEEDRGSWGVGYGYGNFAKGLDLMRGANVDDTLPGPKVRSFTNNIMDPTDPRDVTIDIHMVQGSARDPAVVNDSGVMSSPSYQGASIGIYPYIADVTRRVADDYGVLPQQAQALIWLGYKSEFGMQAYSGKAVDE